MAKPFTDLFPAPQAAAGGIIEWPEDVPGDVPAPDTPVVPSAGLDVSTDPLLLPDDAPPVDLLTGLPNLALTRIPDDLPEDADDAAEGDHSGFIDWA